MYNNVPLHRHAAARLLTIASFCFALIMSCTEGMENCIAAACRHSRKIHKLRETSSLEVLEPLSLYHGTIVVL